MSEAIIHVLLAAAEALDAMRDAAVDQGFDLLPDDITAIRALRNKAVLLEAIA